MTTSEKSTLYDDCVAAGIPTDSHESDLYIKYSPEARALLAKHGKKLDGHNASVFRSQVDGLTWIDLPFEYMPFWRKAAPK